MKNSPTPVLEKIPGKRAPSPVVSELPDRPLRWTFSFRFWRQIQYFGLDKTAASWLVSLLEKLTTLSGEKVDDFLADGLKKKSWRYHDISWTQKNIPVQRKDLHWLAKDYLENEAEYPLVQFQISLGLGRVVGFWDENQVFNIVLLDPLHNMQPSKTFSYRLNPCSPLPCKYTTLLLDVERAKNNKCPVDACPVDAAVRLIPDKNHCYDVCILRLDSDIADAAEELIKKGTAKSMQDIVETGVLSFSGTQSAEQS